MCFVPEKQTGQFGEVVKMGAKIIYANSGAGAKRILHIDTYRVATTGLAAMRIGITDHKNEWLGDVVIGSDEMREILKLVADLI